jgi:UDP-N-acetylmuramate dehydrogenase
LHSREAPLAPAAGVPLAPFSSLGVGGAARWFVRADSDADVIAADAWCVEHKAPLFVLGGGSNLVIADEGFDGLVLQVATRGHELVSAGAGDTVVRARAGMPWDALVAGMVERGLAGLECLSGIPGSVGGTPVQNVGAYGQEVADAIEAVTAFDRSTREMVRLDARDCAFAYRMSRFKREDAGRFIICDVAFRLRPGPPTTTYPDIRRYMDEHRIGQPSIADVRAAVLEIRRRKGMVIDPADPDTRSVGSFFMNPVVTEAARERVAASAGAAPPSFAMGEGRVKIPAAWLIERAGLARGFVDGAVGISTKHPLAIVNRGGATARDVLRLAARIKRQVGDRFGVWLRPEPIFVGFERDADVEFLQNTD